MNKHELKDLSKDDVMEFIRDRLSFKNVASHLRHVDEDAFKKEHRRFDMMGYESKTGECTISNNEILNLFADLGIYDYTSYLFLDFYKGTPTLYLKYFNEKDNCEFDFNNFGTVQIIYKIFEKTIFSEKTTRRRL